MYPMMDPKRSEPMSEEEGVKKMAQIGAIMEEAGMGFGEEDMRLLRDAFMGSSAYEDKMEEMIARYQGLMDDEEGEQEDDEDDGEISLEEFAF